MSDISLGGSSSTFFFLIVCLSGVVTVVAPLVWAYYIWRRLPYFSALAKSVDYKLARYLSLLGNNDRERMLLGLSASIFLVEFVIYVGIQARVIGHINDLSVLLPVVCMINVVAIGVAQARTPVTEGKQVNKPDNAIVFASRFIGLLPCFFYIAIFILSHIEIGIELDGSDMLYYTFNISLISLSLYALSPFIPLLAHILVSPFRSAKPDLGN